MKTRIFVWAVTVFILFTGAFASNYPTWGYSGNIVINPASLGLSAPVVNFPVLIRLSQAAGNFNFSQSLSRLDTIPVAPGTRYVKNPALSLYGGGDIRFTAADGVTNLYYQIENWNDSLQTADIWVLVPSISNSATTTIKMFWGMAGLTSDTTRDATKVFARSNIAASGCEVSRSISATKCGFVTVHHLELNVTGTATNSADLGTAEVTSTTLDTVAADNNLFLDYKLGTQTNAEGSIIGRGTTFNGDGGFGINNSKSDSADNFELGNFTMSAWVNPSKDSTARILSKTGQYHLGINSAGQAEFEWDSNAVASTSSNKCIPHIVTASLSAGWNYVVGVHTASSGMGITVNGNPLSLSFPTPGTPFTLKSAQTITMGYESGDGGTTPQGAYLNGSIDEPRLENVARSADWIKLNYATQQASATADTLYPAPVIAYSPGSVSDTLAHAATHNAVSTGGTLTSCAAPHLPSGFTINSSTCSISGTPTGSSTAQTDTITATGPGGSATAILAFSFVAPPGISYAPGSVSDTVTRASAHAVVSTGGAITTCTASHLPAGYSIDNTCSITGTPTVSSTAQTDTITANGPGGSATTTITFSFVAAPTIGYKRSGITGVRNAGILADTVVISGGISISAYAMSASTPLPPGLSLNATSGIIAGTPTAVSASKLDTVIATGSGGPYILGITIAVSDTSPAFSYKRSGISGTRNVAILADTVVVTGTGAITGYAMSGSTPLSAGLHLDSVTGVISGTPTVVVSPSTLDTVIATGVGGTGRAVVTLAVADTAPNFSYRQATLSGFKNVAITPDTVVSTGGAVTSYAMASSTPLPAGLSLNSSTGIISGAPLVVQSSGVDTVIATGPGGTGVTVVTLAVTPGQEDYTQWSNQQNFPINTSSSGANTGGNVVKFPMLVRLTSGNFTDFATAGTKASLRFARGTTQLKYQVEHFDSTGGQTAEIWVNVDTVFAGNSSQSFRMYWGKSGALDSSRGTGVFDTANGYQAVYHLSTSDSSKDATANNFVLAQNSTGTGHILPVDTTGIIGRAESNLPEAFSPDSGGGILGAGGNLSPSYTLSGTTSSPKLELPDNSNYTISAWANAHGAAGTVGAGMLFCKSGRYYLADSLSGSSYVWELADYKTNVGKRKVDVPLTFSTWHHVVGVYNSSAMTLYVDGVAYTTMATESNASYTHAAKSAGIGRDNHQAGNSSYIPNAGNGMYFSGAMDEIEFSNVARDSNWVKLSYYTQNPGNATPIIAYSPTTVIDTTTQSVTHAPVSTGGVITSCSSSHALPAGLTLGNTCAISGTPTTASAVFLDTITATGPGGMATATLTITVVGPPIIAYSPGSVIDTTTHGATHVPTLTGGPVTSCTSRHALPAGLTIANTCVISGTPTAASSAFLDTITATGPGGTAIATLNLTVIGPPVIAYSPGSVADTISKPATHAPVSTGGPITSCSSSHALPAGLTLGGSCVISGTPTTVSAVNLDTITAIGPGGTGTATLTFTIIGPPILSFSPNPIVDTVTKAATNAPVSTGGPITSCTVKHALPAGLTLGSSCVISGTPLVAVVADLDTILASGPAGLAGATFTITVIGPPIISYSPASVVDTVGSAAAHAASSTGGPISSCSASHPLPVGLILGNSCGIIGTPTAASAAGPDTITAAGPGGTGSTTLTVAVLIARPTVSFSPSIATDTAGVVANHAPAITGAITGCTASPTLPAGLVINDTTCAISGAPGAASASQVYTITASNSTGTGSATLTLSVLISKPTVSFSPGTVVDTVGTVASHTPSTTGTVSGCKISPALPTGLSISPTTCAITGTPGVSSSSQVYTITDSNSTGTGSATLTLSVLISKPTVVFTPSTVVDTMGSVASHTPTTTGTVSGCKISPALPTGLSISATTCAITGTPGVSSASQVYTITDSNSTGAGSATLTLSVLIAKPTVSLTPSTVVDTVGSAVSHTPATTGTVSGCRISPALPTGLSISATTCAITGTPGVSSASQVYTITDSNSTGSGSATLTLSVLVAKPTVSFSPSTVVDTVGFATSHTPTTTGTVSGCRISPTLPAGLSISPTTCAITGTPGVSSASQVYTITDSNGTGAGSATLTLSVLIAKPTVSFTPSTVVDTVGKAASHTPTTTGTVSGCKISPALPAGLNISGTCGITGTPGAASASQSYTITDSNGTGTGSATLILSVVPAPAHVTTQPASAAVAVGATVKFFVVAGGTTPITYKWIRNGVDSSIGGTDTLTRVNVQLSDSGSTYRCIVSNAGGADTSHAAVLTVSTGLLPPVISYSPAGVSDTTTKAVSHVPASTGGAIVSCAVSHPLPAGLSISSACVISGTPTAASAANLDTVTATGPGGSATTTLAITVIGPPLIAYSPGSVMDTVGTAATHAVSSTGGPIATCSVSHPLPAGLVLAGSCSITGIPATASAAAADTLTATGPGGTGSAILTLTVLIAKPTVSYSPSTVVDTAGSVATHTPTTTGTVLSCRISPTLPTGLVISSACVISGTPGVASASQSYTITDSNGTGTGSTTLTLTVLVAKPTVSYSPSTVLDTVGSTATHTPAITSTITGCMSSPALPAGLSINNTTCAITGTPSAAASLQAYTITASNGTGSGTTNLTLTVLVAKPTVSFSPSTLIDTVNTVATHNATTTGAITNCASSPTLPTGLSISATTCAITGTPSVAAASQAYTITASNATGSGTTALTLTVLIARPTVSYSPSTVIDTANIAATHTATTTGTVSGCRISPALPTGLSINNTTCTITGTPSVAAASQAYTITDSNSTGTGSTTLTLTVLAAKPALSYSPSTVIDTVGKAASHSASTSGAITGCTSSPTLPTSLSLSATTCAITGIPSVAAASQAYTITATNSTGSGSATLTLSVLIAKPTVSFISSTVVDTVGMAASHIPIITSTISSCASSPSLPAGFSVNNTTCAVTGTPGAASTPQVYTLTATNGTGTGTAAFTLSVLIAKPTVLFTPATVADTVGSVTVHIPTTTGTVSGCKSSPALPAGLILNGASCVITGTPNAASASQVYTVTDSNSTGTGSATLTLSVLIARPTVSFSPSTVTDTVGKAVTLTPITTGTVSSCASAPALPSPLLINPATCVITGVPSAASSSRTYTITATNGTGSGTASLTFAVVNGVAAPTIAYVRSTVNTFRGAVMIPDSVVSTGGPVTKYSVANLPAGLKLDTLTGVISGTATADTAAANYTVTATGPGGSAIAAVNIAVIEPVPVVSFKRATVIATRTLAIAPDSVVSTGGAVTKYSISPAISPAGLVFDTLMGVLSGTATVQALPSSFTVTAVGPGGSATTVVTLAVYSVPANLSYSDAGPTDVLTVSSSPNTPSVTGLITHYSVSPALPPGLVIDSVGGTISGTPTGNQSFGTNYTITASNPVGSTTTVVNITVVGAPSNLSYLDDAPTYAVGSPISPPDVPTIQGIVTFWTVSPALPAGVYIDGTTGYILGTPTTATASANYTVTGINPGGSTTTTLFLGTQ